MSDLGHPRVVPNAAVPLQDARNIYVARTYAYVAAGKQGIAIIDVEKPEQPRLDQMFSADGKLTDVQDVKIGMVDASAFAFVADGKNGLRVLQILSPEDSPNSYGFSPRPTPKLIASYRTAGPALAISKGIDRDRAVDESGNQIAVFGRRGARLSIAKKPRACTCTMANPTRSQTIRPRRRVASLAARKRLVTPRRADDPTRRERFRITYGCEVGGRVPGRG